MVVSRIELITAREVLDSKGRPMVEAELHSTEGSYGRGSSPCGTSVGRHEAHILRDGETRYSGLGVKKAVENIRNIIAPALKGVLLTDQRMIDERMIELDGTADKSNLGSNALYSVSVAAARAAAKYQHMPLYRYLADSEPRQLPIPALNLINGGRYAGIRQVFQEFLLIPKRKHSYAEALRKGVEIFNHLQEQIPARFGDKSLLIGQSAGHAAFSENPAVILETLIETASQCGGQDAFEMGIDCAASHFYDSEEAVYQFTDKKICREDMVVYLENLIKNYPICLIEDPLDEDDFEGFAALTARSKILIAGDDFFASNFKRLETGAAMSAANAIIFKPNMVGTLTESLETARLAKRLGYVLIPSIRAGGPIDDPVPDLAVALEAPLIKAGAPRTGERTACHNRLMRIEEELGASGRLARPFWESGLQ